MSKQEIERGKKLLAEYYESVNACETMAVADAFERMKLIAEELVDYITVVVYWE